MNILEHNQHVPPNAGALQEPRHPPTSLRKIYRWVSVDNEEEASLVHYDFDAGQLLLINHVRLVPYALEEYLIESE